MMSGATQFLSLALGLLLVSNVFAAEPTEAEKEAVLAIRRYTTNLQFNRDGTVRLARFSKIHVTDEALKHLQAFPEIDYLAIVCPQITDAGIANIAHLTKLDTLLLSGSGITDEGLKSLADLENLEHLYLDNTKIGDDGLKSFAKLTKLKSLSLANTKVTDAGLSHLDHLAELETLVLCETKITDKAFAELAKLPKLKFLDLAGCSLSGVGIEQLKAVKSLKHLTLNRVKLAEAAVLELARLDNLEQLELYDAGISLAGVEQIHKALPKLGVYHSMTGWKPVPRDGSNRSQPNQADGDLSLRPLEPAIKSRLAEKDFEPHFQKHVMPLLGKLGCNGRACHGSFQGQGGFRLSMFGYDFEADHKSLSERIDLKSPAKSLILNKPTSDEEHGGGLRLPPGGWEQTLLRRWIETGAKGVPENAAKFVRLEVTPEEIVFQKAGESVSLKVIAVWSDGSREDVTTLTRFQTNDETNAEVSAAGVITAKGQGDTHVISFYDNGIHATPVIRPITDRLEDNYPQIAAPTRIDELVQIKLKKLGIVPSAVCTDAEFLRRVCLDLIGTLPTPEELETFLKDPSPQKRERKIDELLEHPAYVTWWTTRLCDLTGSNAGYLGNTDMAQATAGQWRAWIEHRVRENVGWDEIVKGIVLAKSRKPGQAYPGFAGRSSTYTRQKQPADFAAEQEYLPHYWFRSNISQPSEKSLAFGFTFLGIRLQCAQCHKHPYDQWSKQDFEQFTEFFTRVQTGFAPDAAAHHNTLMQSLGVPKKLDTAALRRQSYMRIAAEGNPIPWKEVYLAPPTGKPQSAKLLGGSELDLNEYDDPREPLLDWLLTEPNRYLAKAFVNRIWANYFHRGIIHPTDDLNLANPPSNGPLLDYLIKGFIEHGYDMKWLHKEIVLSQAYQRSWRPNQTNLRDEKNYSRAMPRRLPAEVAVDAIIQATAGSKAINQYAKNTATRKIGQHPKSYQTRAIDFSLLIFGKPLRTTNCDCERQADPTLLQSLYMRNDQELFDYLSRKDGWIAELGNQKEPKKPEELVREAYQRALCRNPTEKELADCREYVKTANNPAEGLHDVLWAILNTQEFITNH